MNPLRRTCSPNDLPSAESILGDLDQLYTGALYLTLDSTRAEALVERTVAAGLSDPDRCHLQSGRWAPRLRWLMNELHDATNAPSEVGVINPSAYHIDCTPVAFTDSQLAAIEELPGAAITAVLLTLPRSVRMTLYYSDIEGRPSEMVAEIMAKPCDVVRMYQRLGRLALARLLLTSALPAEGSQL
ncbi:hypothetical protein [Mycolicibacterium smegmatis]|uniref:hypothetical protein n=1 Tax=Mycolicibacterium smegmatis TaxID=1772 RepID=UPI001303033F|nr:hypothetical protein [Mycolicibacterium smegmatis]